MGIPRLQSLVSFPLSKPLSLHPSFDGRHRWQRITDTFGYNHHAIPVPKITATNRILEATACLTAAIEGVQESPPDKLAAIQALRTLLLGEVPPIAPTSPPVQAPCPIIDEEPVVIWSPNDVQQPIRDTGTNSPASTPLSRRNLPAIIEDESDDDIVPLTPLFRSLRAHTAPLTSLPNMSSPPHSYHLQAQPRLRANRDMLSQRIYSTTMSTTLLKPQRNTSSELSSMTTQARRWNTGISSNQKNIGA